MAKHTFVTYNFNDREVANSVTSMIRREDLKAQIIFVENGVSYNSETEMNWEIEHTIAKCDAALFVIGDNPHNSPWSNNEAAHAKATPMIESLLSGMDAHQTHDLI